MKLRPSADDYLSPLAPGDRLVPRGDERGGRVHFAVVTAHVQSTDWLELHADGHRRAVFDSTGPHWVQP
jgi:pyridoxamine 5'-phosphate oxidase